MKRVGLLAISAFVAAGTTGLSTVVLADGYSSGGPVYTCASNAIVASNNQISVDYARQHVDYVEFNAPPPYQQPGLAVGAPVDSEKGWVNGVSGTASAMFNLGSLCNVYLMGRISYFKGETDYWQYVGPIGQSNAKILEGDFRLGKGFNVFPNTMLTPYVGGGLRRWDRDVCQGGGPCQPGGYHEDYEHGYLGGGLLAQISPASGLVLSLSGLVGRTVDSEINGHAVSGGFPIIPFHASLGNSAIYKVESSADYAFTRTIHGNVGVEYTNFRYGESAPFPQVGGSAVEPDSRTSTVTVRVGLGIAFGGDRDELPLK